MSRLLVSVQFAPYAETSMLAARHGLPVVDPDGTWYESFAPDAWLAGGRNAQIQLGHGTTPIGSVVVVAARDRWWEADCLVETDDPNVLERIRVGVPVSVGFDPVHSEDNLQIRVRRHDLAQLKHIAVLRGGEVPAYQGAKITAVAKSKSNAHFGFSGKRVGDALSGVDWRTKLPSGFEDMAGLSDETVVRDRFTLTNRHGSIKWAGDRFVSVGRVPVAV